MGAATCLLFWLYLLFLLPLPGTGEAFPPNSDIVKGRPALQKLWQSVLDSGIASFELTTTEVEADGNLAYEVGTTR